jgi:hypothetical protein
MIEKVSAHNKSKPWLAPALAAVVTVPGPINAAEMMDQKRMERRFFIL